MGGIKQRIGSGYFTKVSISLAIFMTILWIVFFSTLNSKTNITTKSYAFTELAPVQNDQDQDQLLEQQLCQVTTEIQHLRKIRNTSAIDPNKQVVDELLESVTPNPSNFCKKGENDVHHAVVIVDTARSHFMERELIRNTWGSVATYRGWSLHTIFLLGQSDYCLLSSFDKKNISKEKESDILNEDGKLQKEFEKYGDLVVGAFTDALRNSTYKHLLGYKFALENCQDVDIIIKTDDDMFADIPKIIDTREENIRKNKYGNIADIFCHFCQDGPNCTKNEKWLVTTREEWPEDTYPPYCLGKDYIITANWAAKIYSMRLSGGFFWVDDVFIMGKLREIAERKYGQVSNQVNITENVTDKRNTTYITENCEKPEEEGDPFGLFVFLERGKDEFQEHLKCLWKRILRRKTIISLSNY